MSERVTYIYISLFCSWLTFPGNLFFPFPYETYFLPSKQLTFELYIRALSPWSRSLLQSVFAVSSVLFHCPFISYLMLSGKMSVNDKFRTMWMKAQKCHSYLNLGKRWIAKGSQDCCLSRQESGLHLLMQKAAMLSTSLWLSSIDLCRSTETISVSRPESGISSVDWAQPSKYHPKMETKWVSETLCFP